MKRLFFLLSFIFFINNFCSAKDRWDINFTSSSILDSIATKYGINIHIPCMYKYSANEWTSLTSHRSGFYHIDPYNGIIEGPRFIVMFRFANKKIGDYHSIRIGAYYANEFHKSSPTLNPPKEFDASNYIKELDTTEVKYLNMESIAYIDIRPDYMTFMNPANPSEESRIQSYWEGKYNNGRIYYVKKEGYPTFSFLILWKDFKRDTDDKIVKFLKRIVK